MSARRIRSPRSALPTEKKGSSDSGALARLSEKLSKALKDSHGGGVESITRIVERYLSGLPDNILSDAPKDISIYDHSKLRAALSACIVEYCEDSGIHDLKSVLSDAGFMSRDAFLMYSCDISGIQSFIYNITSSGALRSLRGRSFALEMLMEHFIDELLTAPDFPARISSTAADGHCYFSSRTQGARKKPRRLRRADEELAHRPLRHNALFCVGLCPVLGERPHERSG